MSWAFGPWSRLRTRGLGHLIETRRTWSSHLTVSPAAREDLAFWRDYFDHFNGRRSLWLPTHVHTLMHCDAAGKNKSFPGGWGAWTVLNGQVVSARGTWDGRISSFGSTPQELQAVLNGLRSFQGPAGLEGQTIRVMTDNLNAANIINKGSAKADNCYVVAYELLWYCVERNIRLEAQWVPRDKNQFADYLSKIQDPDDWAVSDSTFTALSKQWGPFDIDLFASHRTHRLPAYYATHFAPGAAGVDAFRFRWGRACWAYPPFNLLLRVLKHAQACRARMCLLAPVWPTRDWWPFLTSDGAVFKGFVHGVRVLGKPRDVIAAGQPVPQARLRQVAILGGLAARADPVLSGLAVEFSAAVDGKLAVGTQRQYREPWSAFTRWWEARRLDGSIYDTPPNVVGLYLFSAYVASAEDSVGGGRVRQASAAIHHYFTAAARDSPTGHPICVAARELAARYLVPQARERGAFSADNVARFVAAHGGPGASLIDLMYCTCVSVMFHGFLRWSDMAEVSVHADLLVLTDTHAELFIPRSKTDQLWQGAWVPLARTGGPACPVALIERLLAAGAYQRSPSFDGEDVGPLLRAVTATRSGHRLQQLMTGTTQAPVFSVTYNTFAGHLRRMCAATALPDNLKSHSLRIGGNSRAEELGFPAELRMRHGRWRSLPMVEHYTRRELAPALEMTRHLV
ncbi:hypothetical protein CHLRE_06g253975v5 [Chlamydomonas reinhardtii]|uniref:Tyr recombinase domain-containing protein n=1 Tax=Chlamydomonas reinhardtii TaxID=3055 RepID=A0A2K3DM88_CHLRE|nr:uncharacterized protein CHLRE_06g253975v5 [Chlamydomonas reinhardtii]PNW81631.1 hypothetical protein CHLRE_06g253975v5 [Chlamydomonas reinhardtii]